MNTSKQESKMNGVRVLALLTIMLSLFLPAARAQQYFQSRFIPFGLATNILSVTNYINSGATNITSITNIVPDFNPGQAATPGLISNATVYVAAGGTRPALSGEPDSGIQNGWIAMKPGRLPTFCAIGYQPVSPILTNLTLGFDISPDAVNGTTNCPITVTGQIQASLATNAIFMQLTAADITNLQNVAFIRWDQISVGTMCGFVLQSNYMIWPR